MGENNQMFFEKGKITKKGIKVLCLVSEKYSDNKHIQEWLKEVEKNPNGWSILEIKRKFLNKEIDV